MLKFCSLSRMFLSQPLSHKALMKLIIRIKELNEKSHYFLFLFYSFLQTDLLSGRSVPWSLCELYHSQGHMMWGRGKGRIWLFQWKLVPRVSCTHCVSTQEIFRSSGSLKETRARWKRNLRKYLCNESGNALGHMGKTNQWWDAQSSSNWNINS